MTGKQRPLSVTIVAWLYMAVGTIGFFAHLSEFIARRAFHFDAIEIEAVEIVAIVSGVFLLRGRNRARWLALAWIIFHVAISFDVMSKLIVHSLLCAAIAWALFHRKASEYFRVNKIE